MNYFKNINLIFLIVLFTGLWFPKIGIPILLLLILYLLTRSKISVSFVFILNFLLLLLFIITYIFFWNDPSIPEYLSYYKNKELYMLVELLLILPSIYIITIFIDNKVQLIQTLYFFSIGMYLKSFIITIYTLFTAPNLLAIRRLLDPFTMSISNSPAISLMAVYGTLFSIYYLFTSSKKFFVFHLFIVLGGFIIAILLQARTFFVISFMFLLYLSVLKFNFKKIIKIFFITLLLMLVFSSLDEYMLNTNKYYANTQESTLNRFTHEGVKSNRYEQWSSAVNIIINHPFGGGCTNKSIENTYWFHNLWLDIGRTSGVIPMILILILQLIVMLKLIKGMLFNRTFEKHFIFIFYISLLIGLFVEIALEGNIVLFVFYIFLNSLILQYFQIEKEKYEV